MNHKARERDKKRKVRKKYNLIRNQARVFKTI